MKNVTHLPEQSIATLVVEQLLRQGSQPKELYSIEETAQRLSISERTVRELIDAGMLKSVLIKTNPRATRGSRRISKGQLETYIKKLEIEARS